MLKSGTPAPSFALRDQSGNLVDLKLFLGKKTIVLFFYPQDNTPGCTKQACSFRDKYADFKTYNAEVFGISSDSSKSHQDFKKQHHLPYPLLTDQNGLVSRSYGLKRQFFGLIKERGSFVIDPAGIIREAFSSNFQIDRHIEQCLRAVQKIAQTKGR